MMTFLSLPVFVCCSQWCVGVSSLKAWSPDPKAGSLATHPMSYSKRLKVGHSLGLLTLPTDALSAASFEIDGTLANEKGRVGKPCFSSSKEASGASSADSIVHSSFPLGIQRLFSVINLFCGWLFVIMMFVSVCLLQPVVCGSSLPQGLIPDPKAGSHSLSYSKMQE